MSDAVFPLDLNGDLFSTSRSRLGLLELFEPLERALEFALKLADAEEETENAVIDVVTGSQNSTLLRGGAFASKLVRTDAGRWRKQALLQALD